VAHHPVGPSTRRPARLASSAAISARDPVAATPPLDPRIAVAIAAQGVSSTTRLVLRAGEHETIAETKPLLRLGVVRRA
jgi:hypothetical protein